MVGLHILIKRSRVPLYLQLMEELIKKIDNREFQVNEKLPSERELCDLYDMSRITVRQTLQELEREGYIYKAHGKGTFVASQSYHQNLINLYSFTEEMKSLGKRPVTKVLSFREIEIEERIATKMNLEPLDEVFQVVRLRIADNVPLMYETSYLPKKNFPKLTEQDLKERPMYDVFNEDYQIVVTKATERFSATNVRKEEAKQLQMEENQPAMLVKRYAYYNHNLIEYTVSVARGDKFDYTVELT
ncbi:GntR family transcriptional regulator [Lentibacillus cibarius]|uniref:GntR family transcriptional regulator n=1 Tax=Lentibacillus cibarius TaxID=2583219 RepID=A0A549YET3_9BACI|nr:GntR family transcriptional regulator [Lentibacillus cibarius]TRM10393.1 GntR family transcriptional regulator [Lentibacillus cibarius]